MDCWSNRFSENIEAVGIFCQLPDVFNICVTELRLFLLFQETCHSSCDYLRPENTWDYSVGALIRRCSINTGNFDTIAGL